MKKSIFMLVLLLIIFHGHAQERTVGLVHYDQRVSDGYTLITSHHTTSTFLINNCGEVVHEWTSEYFYGNSVDLLENGLLLRSTKVNSGSLLAGGAGGRVELLDWESNIVWEMFYVSEEYRHHHDAVYMPNGNILILAWDSRGEEEAIQAGIKEEYLGRTLQDIWGEHILEVKPVGNNEYEIVWEWYLWDHLIQDFEPTKDNYGVVSEHPELVDLNYNVDPGNPDWIHANAIDYNEELDQIILGSRNFNEFWVIDHSTTIEEARGHTGGNLGMGGDIVYRYGNPRVYQRGEESDQVFYDPHNPHWNSRNEIIVFNNGNRREPSYSEIFFMNTPVQEDNSYFLPEGEAYGPQSPVKIYSSDDVEGFNYSSFISGAEVLDNGNILICSGSTGTISEITPEGETLWTYVNPLSSDGTLAQGSTQLGTAGITNLTYRARKYLPSFSGLSGKNLNPTTPIELDPLPSLCSTVVALDESTMDEWKLFPNPANSLINIVYPQGSKIDEIAIRDMQGRMIRSLEPNDLNNGFVIDDLKKGWFILELRTNTTHKRLVFIKQ